MFVIQAHIVQRGAVRPLIEMLQSADVQLREMSAFALGRLAQVSFSFYASQLFLEEYTAEVSTV
jgi:HEAT repeat protein